MAKEDESVIDLSSDMDSLLEVLSMTGS